MLSWANTTDSDVWTMGAKHEIFRKLSIGCEGLCILKIELLTKRHENNYLKRKGKGKGGRVERTKGLGRVLN